MGLGQGLHPLNDLLRSLAAFNTRNSTPATAAAAADLLPRLRLCGNGGGRASRGTRHGGGGARAAGLPGLREAARRRRRRGGSGRGAGGQRGVALLPLQQQLLLTRAQPSTQARVLLQFLEFQLHIFCLSLPVIANLTQIVCVAALHDEVLVELPHAIRGPYISQDPLLLGQVGIPFADVLDGHAPLLTHAHGIELRLQLRALHISS
mmetsp:Transcript_79649/g.228586  ORF Transcript_79649/g.228586 Transcript_79649/m.228586 type:complete len:207 (+) Transcript_79649:430-1050(+)